MNKSYVSLSKCIICGENKGEIILNKRLRKVLPSAGAIFNTEPCDSCKAKMKEYVFLVEAVMRNDGRPESVGSSVGLKDVIIEHILPDDARRANLLKLRMGFVEKGFIAKLQEVMGLNKEE